MGKTAILRSALDMMHFSGATGIVRRRLQGLGSIFCLHQILPGGGRQTGFAPNSKLECEPEFLAGMIRLARSRGLETISLADAVARMRNGDTRPFAVFTLDDGYKDNQLFAQPVFDALQCPYTIFVAPRIVEGTSELWWRLLELVIKSGDHFKAEIARQGYSLATATNAEKWQAFNTLFPVLENLEQQEQRVVIRRLCAAAKVDPDAYCRSVAMDWNDLKAINRDPLCTIGAHTMNHHAVGRMHEADAFFELNQSRKDISKALDEDILFNAYPYGDEPNAIARDFVLAEKAGYAASVTTRKGVIFPGHAQHLQALPRIMVSGRFQQLRYVDAMMSGLPTALSNKFSKVNVA
ncbi:polysaccharide deacetylase family protein [Aestuariivirga litoralis]|uniref:polysaccharide deacetylase family protein n=1 Tax=Aestuariivirga litoralis TaxID=2650924 RepID=UPI0018C7000E|nr:polysaccharide deacetylase family protein [Aestuariivirga litoralis]MBG1231782.1 polysaccharide deacetylase family protein [Aestuariivirga litoralis]